MYIDNICPQSECTGCSACFSACKKHAITMVTDQWGYLYPSINQDLCIGCNACKKVCPQINLVEKREPKKAYAAYHKIKSERNTCASGGMATALSKLILSEGGVVYGVAQKNCMNIGHVRIDKIEDVELLKGSKYVHSSTTGIFSTVKEDLKVDKKVLFIGTPCQVAGLLAFIGPRALSNLYTIDLCCHGVPSYQFLKDNLNLLKAKKKINLPLESIKVSFRDKKVVSTDSIRILYGFYTDSIADKSRIYSAVHPDDLYISGFLSGLYFRENCFACNYAEHKRVSDLTLADFWGLESSLDKEMDADKGVSCILVNSQKGADLLSKIDNVQMEERPVEEAIKGNKQFKAPYPKHKSYEAFKKDYLEYGFEKASRKHLASYIRFHKRRQVLKPLINLAKSIKFVDTLYRKIFR